MEVLTELTARIVAAYVERNALPIADLPAVVSAVHRALSTLGAPAAEAPAAGKLTAAQIRKSITPDHLVSFEDGRTYKSLRRHLSARGLTADDYRRKWGLPSDYPMVSSAYSATRSALAKSIGLGAKATAKRKAATRARR